MMSSTTIILLLSCLVALSVAQTIVPCDVTLDSLQQQTTIAHKARAACEASYFTGASCTWYWAEAETLLQMETNFRECRKETIDKFLIFLVGSNWTNGEIQNQARITREVVIFNAAQTQTNFTLESAYTRTVVKAEALETQVNLTIVTTEQNSFTRTNLTLEAQNTRYTVQEEANHTRNVVHNESVTTRAFLEVQEILTRDLIETEAGTTREFVADSHSTTRQFMSDHANQTRQTVVTESQNIQATVVSQSQETREVLSEVISEEGLASRTNTTAEAVLTRTAVHDSATATQNVVSTQAETTRETLSTAVSEDGQTTRNAINTDGNKTRTTIVAESNNVQNAVAVATNDTKTTINNGVNTLSAKVDAIQTSFTDFETLFIKLLIEGSFSSDPSTGRVDLFQRPAAHGGYFETMQAIVLEVVAYNLDNYSFSYSEKTYINGLLNSAASFAQAKNYRKAWEFYRTAYNKVVSP